MPPEKDKGKKEKGEEKRLKELEKEAEKELERERKRRLREPLVPAPSEELEDDEGMIVRSIALHAAATLLASNPGATSKQTIAMATRFEAYLLTGQYVDVYNNTEE